MIMYYFWLWLFILLLVIDDENWFRVFEGSSQPFLHIQIVLNTPCQFFARTLARVTFSMPVDYMSIGLLVTDLVMLAIEIDFVFSKN